MSEGHVYLCTWSKKDGEHTIALKRNRSLKVSAPELDEAKEKMWDLLCEKFGDGEAVLEYETPPPEDAAEFQAKYGSPHLVTVSGNDGVGRLINERAVYPKGHCRTCGRYWPPMSSIEPETTSLPTSDGAVSSRGDFFSEAFLSLLTTKERARLKLTPVHGPKTARKRFFRLDGKVCAHFVRVPAFEARPIGRCPKCKRPFALLHHYNNKLYRFLALQDLPKPLPQVFVAGDAGGVYLCLTRARFDKLRGRQGTRDIMSSRVWVVPNDHFARTIRSKRR